MADYVYVGRSRHRVKLALYQVLTLGIYGRVWMYKLLREFDGHEALFLDRRPYVPLLILPFIGPFFVKRRVAILVDEIIHHDVTSPRFRRRSAQLLGLIPLVPLFHLYVQKAINHHWRMHTKVEELDLKKVQLEQLERRKSVDAQAEAKTLAKEVAVRQKELDDLRSAAIALREAEALRRQAEREGGLRRSRLGFVKRLTNLNPLRRKAASDAGPGPLDEPEEPPQQVPSEAPPAERGRKKRPVEPEPIEEPTPEPVEGEPAPRAGLLARFLPKRKAAEPVDDEAPSKKEKDAPKEEGLSRAEIRDLRRKAKEERKAAKVAAKEEKQKAKERRKADKLAAKEARRAEKVRRKAEKKAAKEAARAAKKKESGRAKGKPEHKKEKAPTKGKKPAKKSK